VIRRALFAGVISVVLLSSSSCRRSSESEENKVPLVAKTTDRQVHFFFEQPDAMLAAEIRNLRLPESPVAAAAPLIREYLKGPAGPQSARPFPIDVELRAVYVLPDGTAVVDLGGPTLSSGWTTGSHAELMAAYSLVQTLTANVPQVKRVRILLNGQQGETLAGHLRIDRSLAPMAGLVRGG